MRKPLSATIRMIPMGDLSREASCATDVNSDFKRISGVFPVFRPAPIRS